LDDPDDEPSSAGPPPSNRTRWAPVSAGSGRDGSGRAGAVGEEPDRTWLSASSTPLAKRYDVALLDLDGVVYVGDTAVPAAVDALGQARSAGMRLAFVTNNAARPPAAVADRLIRMGVRADAAEIITSAQTAAHYLADRLPAGSAVLVIGTDGLVEALRERGLRPVLSADDGPSAVVQGYSPTLSWAQLAEGAVAIRRGTPWVATNLDSTVPSPRGPLPGNGAMVAALRHATGKDPVSTGKPEPTMHRETVERTGATTPLVVGDRLDTDISGAYAVGCASLLVLSGVTDARTLLSARPSERPTYLGWDLTALLTPHPAPAVSGDSVRCGGWLAQITSSGITLRTAPSGPRSDAEPDLTDGQARRRESGRDADEALDGLRALAAAAWTRSSPEPPDIGAGDPAARGVLDRLSLSVAAR
jgi:glycerol-1-phosphatase